MQVKSVRHVQAGFAENALGLATPSRVCPCVLSPAGAFRYTVWVQCMSFNTQNRHQTTITRHTHDLTREPPDQRTHSLKNVNSARERHLLHALQSGPKANGGRRARAVPVAAAMQLAHEGRSPLKMEAAPSSATITEEKKPPTAWQRTVSTLVQQLQADGDHLRG